MKSYNDALEVKKTNTSPNHGLEWFMTAAFSTACGFGLFGTLIGTLKFDAAMVPTTWVVMDIATNAMMGHNPFTHVGSGGWDIFYKTHFGDKAYVAIWISKLILTVAAWLVYSNV